MYYHTGSAAEEEEGPANPIAAGDNSLLLKAEECPRTERSC